MPPLHGVGVLVTRPEQQAAPLCRLLEARGAQAFPFPTITIRPAAERRTLAAGLGPIANFDRIVFTSANAVRFGSALLEDRRDLTLAAIGPATARALNQAGYRVALQPTERIDSEGLLALPAFERVAGSRVLIVKGAGGRDLLEGELTRRGAQVATVEVYVREPVRPAAGDLARLEGWLRGDLVQVITATSAEVGAHLLALGAPALRAQLANRIWLVPGARVAAALREHGLAAPLLVAASAEDQDLVAALVAWRGGA